MKTKIVIIMLLTLVLTACKEKDKLQVEKREILGTWHQVEPICTSCDTITFYSNGTFRSNGQAYDDFYEFKSKNIIQINQTRTLEYIFSDNYKKLTIKKYVIDLTGTQDIDIILLRTN